MQSQQGNIRDGNFYLPKYITSPSKSCIDIIRISGLVRK